MVITETKGELKDSVIYKGFKYELGTGGIHGCCSSGIYETDENHIILTCDVTSLYPSIAIQNRFYPEHLKESFCDIYEEVFLVRNKAKKEGNKSVNEGLKLALNG